MCVPVKVSIPREPREVYAALLDTATQLHGFDRRRARLPFHHVTLPARDGRTESGLRHAIVTVTSRNFEDADTMYELARQTTVRVPLHVDDRGERFASTWWMQPRGRDIGTTTGISV